MAIPDLYVIGAAARATAAMAARAGFQVGCFDAYGDTDLIDSCGWTSVIDFRQSEPGLTPDCFREIVGQTPWCYTGPLENAAGWLESASVGTNLWGNSAQSCRAVRDIIQVAEFLHSIDSPIGVPEIRPFEDPPNRSRNWIFKPVIGSGGWDIRMRRRFESGSFAAESSDRPAGYWQKFVRGKCYGATVASSHGKAVLVGFCESFRGAPGRPFAYSGSAGPCFGRNVRRIMPGIEELATGIARRFGLEGLCNLDLVYESDTGRWFLLEINPRPSASMEVLELAIRQPIFDIHKRIFQQDAGWFETARAFSRSLESADRTVRKSVVYAGRKVRASQIFRLDLLSCAFGRDETKWPAFWSWSDRPQPGSTIPAGAPVCSMYGVHFRDETSDSRDSGSITWPN